MPRPAHCMTTDRTPDSSQKTGVLDRVLTTANYLRPKLPKRDQTQDMLDLQTLLRISCLAASPQTRNVRITVGLAGPRRIQPVDATG